MIMITLLVVYLVKLVFFKSHLYLESQVESYSRHLQIHMDILSDILYIADNHFTI